MGAPNIQSFKKVVPMIYAYNTPGVPYNEGWTKIGYTESQSVDDRINQQTHTAGIRWELAWMDNAMYKDGTGEYFTDRDFHNYLTVGKKVERRPDTEWFRIGGPEARGHFDTFAARRYEKVDEGCEYTLRKEQEEAVEMTRRCFADGGEEFLWNAKPRFGKTLTAYDFVRRMGCQNVLIVTNRPSVANSWADDFFKFIAWRGEYEFVSETDAIKDKAGVVSRELYVKHLINAGEGEEKKMIAFVSLQDLKGSVYFGGKYDKLRWISEIDFDLLIVDESQEGVDTMRTDRAFRNIKRNHTLYLSGTPFKALASEQFSDSQIFNWSYADEQEAKANWDGDGCNPYESLPRLAMYTYQLSDMIYDKIQRGVDLSDDENVDYAFDLSEFFATNESDRFVHEDDVRKFLHALSTQEKYPFSTPELRKELPHTLWLLNRVASVKALAKLLREDPVFCEYEIVIAAGDGRENEDDVTEKSFDKVKAAIATYDKTITLSVGQLTVGVTIPEWSGVLMLCNLQSPSSYMQAAFRAQNPCTLTVGGVRMRKETAYVFDFDPARTLIIFDEFANNLSKETVDGRGTGEDRKENIKRLLNFFPVIGEDDEGRMVELDAAQILSIPRKVKSQEVVRRGFMSNFLFQNIGNIFGAPKFIQDIVGKLTPAHEEPKKRDKKNLEDMSKIPVDDKGNVDIPDEIVIGTTQDLFGPKRYAEMKDAIAPQIEAIDEAEDRFGKNSLELQKQIDRFADTVKDTVKNGVVAPIADSYKANKAARNRMERQVEREVDREIEKIRGDYEQQKNIAKAELDRKRVEAETDADIAAADNDYMAALKNAKDTLIQAFDEFAQRTVEEKPQELVEQMERRKAENDKKSIEDTVRDYLRGFSRTIPSFIMAYGDEKLTLSDFDDYTEDDVFEEVTGITEDEFRFLRDGGDYTDPESGETEHFEGHLFDEVVFDDSIQEFLHKKHELADYFEEGKDEDIFDYIPPQKTNQIFTPRWVVEKMVDELEENNPGCFDDPDKTFADLYMKSGLYIAEIVKRLFRSEKMKSEYPDDDERIRHILRKQVYGMAPTRIIYLIATNFILGFDDELKSETKNFVQADAAAAAKEGRLEELVNECFDVVN